MDHAAENRQKWNDLAEALLKIKRKPTGTNGTLISDLLAELQARSSKLRVIHDQRLIHSLISHLVSGLVDPCNPESAQVVRLITSILTHQGNVSLSSETSDRVIVWISDTLRFNLHKPENEIPVQETLCAMSVVLRDAPDHTDEIYISLGGTRGSLIQALEAGSPWSFQASAMQCLHHLTYVTPDIVTEARQHCDEIFPAEVVSSIQRIVIHVLKQQQPNSDSCSHILYMHLIASALSVLYNLVVCAPNDVLGNIIVSACRPFVFYGLPGFTHDELVQHTSGPEVDIPQSSGVESDASSRSYTNRNRRKRLRRKRAQPSRSPSDSTSSLYTPTTAIEGVGLGFKSPPPAAALDSVSLKPQWAKECRQLPVGEEEKDTVTPGAMKGTLPAISVKTPAEVRISGSETDFSDYEGGGEKESTLTARVRQCSLQAINSVIDKIGKQHKFSYWPPLMCQNPSLMTSVLKDPSPSVRMASLQVINTFLLDSSQVLTLAVDDEGKGSYATLGHQLGTSIRELHRCLSLALLSEKFPGALVRTLKTIELLVENVNYSKLKPGMLTKVVTHVKYFMRYKEAVVRANAFSVMVSVLMIKPQVPELQDILLRFKTPAPATLVSPPEVTPPSLLEEELPGEEEELVDDENEEAESKLEKKMAMMNWLSEDEGEKVSEDKDQGKSMVSWLIQRCMDSLLTPDHEAVRGIYIQVQLQSLKVLSALVSEHLNIIHQSLPLIQHVISVCSKALREPAETKPERWTVECSNKFEVNDVIDPTLMSPDPGVVVEHAYTLLGSLLGAVKIELEKGTSSCVSVDQVQQLWLWTLQGPLHGLLQMASSLAVDHNNFSDPSSIIKHDAGPDMLKQETQNWRNKEEVEVLENQDHHKQLVATATVLSHFSPTIFESLGEKWITQVVTTVKWLVTNPDPDLRLAGVRIMAIIVGFPGVVGNPLGVGLLRATVVTTSGILAQKESNVNRDRLLASWALANVSSVLELYSESWQRIEHNASSDLLPTFLLARLLEVGVRACKDKDKIKPHGVRCVGNVTSFLHANQASDPAIAPLVTKAIETLIVCSSTGNNMKTRWNACHALGNILTSGRLSITDVPWRSQVLTTLGNLVENFKNYKVRIQACSALCGLNSRDEFGQEYYGIWRVLLHGLDNAQNIIDYQEIRHRDELINQICQGICQLAAHLTLEDAGALCELLQVHQDMATPLLKKAHSSLPPERTGYALKAHSRVEELLLYDALTEPQEQALVILQSLTASDFSGEIC
ncbi:HEAT repeat-containing protein 6-like [Penaeus monodon]|uniref:HEAT repeat-containing protein 6-like n=1 Tax=Penaeus monodon TaxID=6687 RepID=UPI0018A786D6|nr:HEAT repeat-containing protein 6-like [Penaeus monodon]